jgi:hypothetical protein
VTHNTPLKYLTRVIVFVELLGVFFFFFVKFRVILFEHLALTRVSNDDGLLGGTALASNSFHLLDNVESFNNLAENDVLAVEPRGLDGTDEELGSIGVGTSVGHRKSSGLGVLQLEVLISELSTIDGLATGTVALGEVTTLAHEVGNDSMESASLEVKGLARSSLTFLTSAEGTEILGSLGDNVVEKL